MGYKMLVRFDFFLWDVFMPNINANFFKWRINSVLAMLYISIYPLPRKFLINYFSGKQKQVIVGSRKLLVCNHLALRKLVDKIESEIKENKNSGTLQICQTEVDDPNYKYSIGSFKINYQLDKETVKLNVHSRYSFKESPDRITKHLHNWLSRLKNKGKASDFEIEGDQWQTDLQEFKSLKAEKNNIKSPKFKLLV